MSDRAMVQEDSSYIAVDHTSWPAEPDLNSNGADATDVVVARELFELPKKEREKVYDDIHSVAQTPEETLQFVEESLKQMDTALSQIPKSKRKALERAIFLKPSLASDIKFKTMFLRAACYDATRAADRMARFYERKLSLFGEDKLAKKITSDDLKAQDVARLDMMGCRINVGKDSSGRPIWFYDVSKQNNHHMDGTNRESVFRCFWHRVMASLSEDETAQIRGICHVFYLPGSLLGRLPSEAVSNLIKFGEEGGNFLSSMPYRITSFHFCSNDPSARFLFSDVRMAFDKSVRLRTRTHFGNDLEIGYSLSTYGINCDLLFKGDDGAMMFEKIPPETSYLQLRRETEKREAERQAEEEAKSGIILHPRPRDVLVGRGRPYREYPGNQHLGRLIDEQLEKYRSGDRFEKSCILLDVVKSVDEYDGRFLQKTEGGWVIVAEKVAREKVAKGFRFKMGKDDGANTDDEVIPLASVEADTPMEKRSSKRYKPDPRMDRSMR